MAAVLADTHAILWYLTADARISRAATAAMDSATTAGDPIFVSAITMVEIQYLVEKGRLSAADQRIVVAAVDDLQNPARLVPLDRIVVDALGLRRAPKSTRLCSPKLTVVLANPEVADKVRVAFLLSIPMFALLGCVGGGFLGFLSPSYGASA